MGDDETAPPLFGDTFMPVAGSMIATIAELDAANAVWPGRPGTSFAQTFTVWLACVLLGRHPEDPHLGALAAEVILAYDDDGIVAEFPVPTTPMDADVPLLNAIFTIRQVEGGNREQVKCGPGQAPLLQRLACPPELWAHQTVEWLGTWGARLLPDAMPGQLLHRRPALLQTAPVVVPNEKQFAAAHALVYRMREALALFVHSRDAVDSLAIDLKADKTSGSLLFLFRGPVVPPRGVRDALLLGLAGFSGASGAHFINERDLPFFLAFYLTDDDVAAMLRLLASDMPLAEPRQARFAAGLPFGRTHWPLVPRLPHVPGALTLAPPAAHQREHQPPVREQPSAPPHQHHPATTPHHHHPATGAADEGGSSSEDDEATAVPFPFPVVPMAPVGQPEQAPLFPASSQVSAVTATEKALCRARGGDAAVVLCGSDGRVDAGATLGRALLRLALPVREHPSLSLNAWAPVAKPTFPGLVFDFAWPDAPFARATNQTQIELACSATLQQLEHKGFAAPTVLQLSPTTLLVQNKSVGVVLDHLLPLIAPAAVPGVEGEETPDPSSARAVLVERLVAGVATPAEQASWRRILALA